VAKSCLGFPCNLFNFPNLFLALWPSAAWDLLAIYSIFQICFSRFGQVLHGLYLQFIHFSKSVYGALQWFWFSSVWFRFLVFAIAPVRFMFGFGSCGSWSISVWFGSVFGTFCIDICFFSGVGKANPDCFPQEVYCFSQEVS
jgi:hypothetical protein